MLSTRVAPLPGISWSVGNKNSSESQILVQAWEVNELNALEETGRDGIQYEGSSDSPALASQVARITGTHHHAQQIFAFLLETGFHHVVQCGLELLTSEMGFQHVSQAGLKLLASSDPPTLASQRAGITGVSHKFVFNGCLAFHYRQGLILLPRIEYRGSIRAQYSP
ncbi:hypothetical protein AAY473_013760 [Plecturocebus cupreus]